MSTTALRNANTNQTEGEYYILLWSYYVFGFEDHISKFRGLINDCSLGSWIKWEGETSLYIHIHIKFQGLIDFSPKIVSESTVTPVCYNCFKQPSSRPLTSYISHIAWPRAINIEQWLQGKWHIHAHYIPLGLAASNFCSLAIRASCGVSVWDG